MLHARMLRYLDEVARCGSIRKAAAKLNVASSAVNRQIIAFEDELGTPLFERLSHGLRLTAAGEIMIAHVRKTLKEYQLSSERIDRLRDYHFPAASIATVGGLACDLLAKALMELRAERPFTRLFVSVMDADDIMGVVAAGDFDLGFAFDLPDFGGVTRAASLKTRYGAVMVPDHPLAREPALRVNALQDYPLIAPHVGVLIRDQFDDACLRNDIKIDPVVESDSFEFLRQFALSNKGVALLNELDIDDGLRTGALVFVPIVELKGKTQTISVVHRTRGTLDPLPGLIVERLSTLLEQRRGSG
ncbi:DNA-binding transcriptional regulator, LysR family [Kaistia soli DSM 19436]|uniref:DNA-binding transcriptional regulator, LysR family n=1 Tax=Kaistia soli DSM 19436 TaxID=1122133 RepID=A0A1M5PHP8_9HYPH|nr:LysR family transcriptional regulator [Kaistia soli]SHH01009.1 DNA-binding transcriptional regulator, LysR family [Kaistia soli DSM 19436]